MMKTTTKQVQFVAWCRIEEYSHQHAPPPSPNLWKPYVATLLPRLTSTQSETLNLATQHPRNIVDDNNREITHTTVPLRIDHKHASDPDKQARIRSRYTSTHQIHRERGDCKRRWNGRRRATAPRTVHLYSNGWEDIGEEEPIPRRHHLCQYRGTYGNWGSSPYLGYRGSILYLPMKLMWTLKLIRTTFIQSMHVAKIILLSLQIFHPRTSSSS
jgi:hypothetical protein